jgi:uncharacterized protein (DUF1501 family)
MSSDAFGCKEYRDLSRRQFLSNTAKVSAIAALGPAWLPKVAFAKDYVSNRDIIVSVYLRGGCDGLTMCVPYGDADYYAARPTLAVPPPGGGANAATELDSFFGLPPALSSLITPFQDGKLAIIHATGSTDPSRSHFDAQRFMEVGEPGNSTSSTGWLGRHLASAPPLRPDSTLRGVGLNYGLPLTLAGGPLTLPVPNLDTFGPSGYSATRQARLKYLQDHYGSEDSDLATVASNTVRTIAVLDLIDFAGYQPAGGAVYPTGNLGYSMKTTAALIKADVGVEAVHIDVSGWDTHAAQGVFTGTMFNLMSSLAGSLFAFYTDVFSSYNGNVVVLVMSEFGRVLFENGSAGTDHGHGNVIFVLGHGVNGGQVYSQWPGLQTGQLFAGRSLQVTIDFRDVVSEIVQKRLANGNLGYVFPNYTPNFHGIVQG